MMSAILIKLMSPAPTISGMFCVKDACATQKPLPATEMISMDIETSSVCFVCTALNICGTSISVQRNDAVQPNTTSICIFVTIFRKY